MQILKSLNRGFEILAIAANAVGTLVVLALVAVVNFDVVSRGAFNAPFLGAVEVVQFSMVLIVFLQLPDVVRVGRLTRSDGFLSIMQDRKPRAGRLLGRVIDAVAAVMMALIAMTIWPDFIEMWASGGYFGIPGVFTAPWWPIKLSIVFGSALCALLFAMRVVYPGSKQP